MSTLLVLDKISKSYSRNQWALENISFSVEEGEFISIIGPSGAGKSTLLRCINRMVEPTEGSIIFDGHPTNDLSRKQLRALRTQIGMIFQHYNLVGRLSVVENVLHGRLGSKSVITGALGIYHETEKRRSQQLLSILGLEDHMFKRCDQLSGGQKQRVGIARALIQDPKLMLCDEPIASLDPSSAKTIMDHLRSITTTMGITVLVNLHQVEVALRYSDRIIGVNQGRIVFEGTPAELTQEKIHEIYSAGAGDLIMDASMQSKEIEQAEQMGEAQQAYEVG